jgi:ribosomal protein S18 acetylase RimI-like enzyme
MSAFDERVWAAHGDAWQAEGRLRAALGGGAAELPGVRLMASGLPHARWNNGDVSDPARVDWQAVRAWYAARAGGAGVPWGVQVPAGLPLERGRYVFRKRCMGLLPAAFRAVGMPTGVAIRAATAEDLAATIAIDAAAFGDPPSMLGPWIAPHFAAQGFTAALALLDGEPAGIGTAILTDGWAGACVGIFGIAVLERARRRGIASGLTSWLLNRGFEAGATLAHLNPDSDAAQRLYARLGFIETQGLDIYTDL